MDNVSTDASPKAVRQGYKKAQAPPPPSSTNQRLAPPQPVTSANHQRSLSSDHTVVSSPYERPSVPPPAPPKRPDKPNIAHKGDLPTGDKMMPADMENRPSGNVIGALNQTCVVDTEARGETKVDTSDLPRDYDLGLGTQSVNASGVSEIGELSWSSESDQSQSAAPPKEDIRKMTAQLKAQWWHNSPTPADRAASRMTTEISGTFNPRVSPSERYYDSRLDEKLEAESSETDVCRPELENVDTKPDDADKRPETADRKSDTVDTNPDDVQGECRTTDENLEDLDRQRLATDSEMLEALNSELEKLDTESTVDKNIPTIVSHTPPTPSPRSSVELDHVTDTTVAECSEEVSDQTASSEAMTAAAVTRPMPRAFSEDTEPGTTLTEPARGKDILRQASLSGETTPTSPPPTRPKPLKSPPARPPPFASSAEGRFDISPALPPRKPSVDGKLLVPESPAELPTAATSPVQPDLPPKTRTLERVRPEKPPPPLPRSLRSQVSEPAAESQPDVDSRGDDVFDDQIAMQDEDTHL